MSVDLDRRRGDAIDVDDTDTPARQGGATVALLAHLARLAAAPAVAAVRWRRRPKQAAEKAVAWWWWNLYTGGKVGCGRAMWDRHEPDQVRRRVTLALTRTVAIVAACTALWALHADHGPGGALGRAAATVAVTPPATWLAVAAIVHAWHWWRWVLPLRRVLLPMLGWPERRPSRLWIEVPRSRARQETRGVRVTVPKDWFPSPKARALVVEAAHAKLRLDDVTDRWVFHSRYRYLQIRPAHHAPATAYLSEVAVQRALAVAKGGQVLLGLAAGGKDGPRPLYVDLDSDSPHILISAGTGGGKSVTIRTLAAQAIRRGWLVWVIDVKRHSHSWMRGLPGVRYFRDIADVHEALLAAAEEGDRRNRAWDDVPFGAEGPTFTRLVIVCEEMNGTLSYLRKWWRQNKAPGDPAIPDSVGGLGEILFMGRAVQVNVIAVAQSATARDLGGPEQRENFFCRVLARYTVNAWNMLVPECAYVPASSHPGRAQVCIAGVATETQQVYMDEAAARAYALAGRQPAAEAVSASQTPSDLRVGGENVATRPPLATGLAALPAGGEAEPALMSAVELSADKGIGLVPIKYHALRRALSIDPEAPKPVKRGGVNLFDPEQVTRWARNRPIAGARDRQKTTDGQSTEEGGSDR